MSATKEPPADTPEIVNLHIVVEGGGQVPLTCELRMAQRIMREITEMVKPWISKAEFDKRCAEGREVHFIYHVMNAHGDIMASVVLPHFRGQYLSKAGTDAIAEMARAQKALAEKILDDMDRGGTPA